MLRKWHLTHCLLDSLTLENTPGLPGWGSTFSSCKMSEYLFLYFCYRTENYSSPQYPSLLGDYGTSSGVISMIQLSTVCCVQVSLCPQHNLLYSKEMRSFPPAAVGVSLSEMSSSLDDVRVSCRVKRSSSAVRRRFLSNSHRDLTHWDLRKQKQSALQHCRFKKLWNCFVSFIYLFAPWRHELWLNLKQFIYVCSWRFKLLTCRDRMDLMTSHWCQKSLHKDKLNQLTLCGWNLIYNSLFQTINVCLFRFFFFFQI